MFVSVETIIWSQHKEHWFVIWGCGWVTHGGELIGKSSGRWHTFQITEHPRTIGWSLCFIFTPLVLLHVKLSLSFFLRVAWEAVIRYLPKSSWESWSQGWWMNACLRVSIHWEYHLPATLSGTIQTMETVWNSPVLHNMFTFYVIFTTISQCLISVQSTMFEPHTQLNTLVRSWTWLITCFISSESTFATRRERHISWICQSVLGWVCNRVHFPKLKSKQPNRLLSQETVQVVKVHMCPWLQFLLFIAKWSPLRIIVTLVT